MSPSPSLSTLQQTWKTLYSSTLPSLAKSRDPVQPSWPVVLDHCFARIILDNAIGVTKPWMDVVKAPAVKHMTEKQLRAAVELGERVQRGEVDLVELDRRSLELRGKAGPAWKRKQAGGAVKVTEAEKGKDVKVESAEDGEDVKEAQAGTKAGSRGTKRKSASEDDGENQTVSVDESKRRKGGSSTTHRDTGTISRYFLPSPTKSQSSPPPRSATSSPSPSPPASPAHAISKPSKSSMPPLQAKPSNSNTPSQTADSESTSESQTIDDALNLIATSTSLTPFRKEVLTLLCHIPRGHYTTYAAMARHVNRVRASKASSPNTTIPTTNSKSSKSTSKAKSKSQNPPSKTSATTCARAIGNAMRNNPFAPLVPCHRVLAADGSIGGFGGDWGDEGRFVEEKRRLLREEGVRFDGRGKVVGRPWEFG